MFRNFKNAVNTQFQSLTDKYDNLFTVNVDKDELWELYLDSFPEGTNPIYKERTEHDCQCCRQFINNAANVIAITKDLKIKSIWDVTDSDMDSSYKVVASELAKYVKKKAVSNVFLNEEKNLGTDYNHQILDDDSIKKWEHFHYKLPNRFVNTNNIGSMLSMYRANKEVFKRSLEEITLSSAEIVLDLINQNSIYRGEEHKSIVTSFIKFKEEFDNLSSMKQQRYCWVKSAELGGVAKIRNTVIGTLMADLSEGKDLNSAVASYEDKVAPQNYKRTSAPITKGMMEKARKKLKELGAESSIYRRYATIDDITINNILFVNNETKKAMDVFDEIAAETKVNKEKLNKVEEIDIETFINDIVPKAEEIKILVENNHKNNLVSLVAPKFPDSKNILKWNNNFSWSYTGDVTDSIKENVKKAGGNVTGDLRFSIQWNDSGNNNIDFDAHCREPKGAYIHYAHFRKPERTPCGGQLDVDIIHPEGKVAVENITWADANRLEVGNYDFFVHNYSQKTSKEGFTAQIEFKGKVWDYSYDKPLRGNQKIPVATVTIDKNKQATIKHHIKNSEQSSKIWGIETNKFQNVNIIMNSPNHWDGEKTGNKHYFFILENCINPEGCRGFFNEYLSEELKPHRKVFEIVADKTHVSPDDEQLSGLGFSSTKKTEFICEVSGTFNRTLKVKV